MRCKVNSSAIKPFSDIQDYIYEVNKSACDEKNKKKIESLISGFRYKAGICPPEMDPCEIDFDLYNGVRGLTIIAAGINDYRLKKLALNSLIEIFRDHVNWTTPTLAKILSNAKILMDATNHPSFYFNTSEIQVKMRFILGEFFNLFICFHDKEDPETRKYVLAAREIKEQLQSPHKIVLKEESLNELDKTVIRTKLFLN